VGDDFGTTDVFWLNLQMRYDLQAEKDKLGRSLDGIEPVRSA
jgi:plasmid maintenance system antidote protein VapI